MILDINMLLNNINFPYHINTSDADPLSELFIPALCNSVSYDVAVGYFSSYWLRDASEGIARFSENGGKSRWVISPDLSEQDIDAIQNAKDTEFEFENLIENNIDKLIDALNNKTRDMLCWLIKDEILTFKIAIPKNNLSGIFHSKVGVFTDSENNSISFNGSYNLTGAAKTNWETIDVFRTWNDAEKMRVNIAKNQFEKIWNKKDTNLNVYDPSEIIISRIRSKTTTKRPYKVKLNNKIIKPDFIKLRSYQVDAVNGWFNNNGRGMYVMATGSGKTITALATISRLCQGITKKGSKIFVLIVVPYKHLLEQWVEEIKMFGISPVQCFGDSKQWSPKLQSKLNSLELGSLDVVLAISTNASFSLKKLQSLIMPINYNFLFVADEMHNLGSLAYLKSLPTNAKFRLGLTATPDRKGDLQGTESLKRYFGDSVIEFSLRDAIKHDFLCEYYYYPILCPLSDDEMYEYKEITKQIAQAFMQSKEDALTPKVEFLLRLRAGILSLAENKLVQLKKILKNNYPSKYNLIYSGDAKVNDERHIEMILKISGNEIGMRIRKFTADESMDERKEILEQFKNGNIDAIAAIRCLDEGVDVPRTETAYILASSSNPRQFIQRRGRVLRKAKGKKYAYIYDFIAVPNISEISDENEFNIERRMLKSELLRVKEFAETAINTSDTFRVLGDLKKQYKLLDV